MKRTFATTTVAAVALLCVPACKGGAGDAAKLIPDSATVMGGFDLKALSSSDLYTKNEAMMKEGEAGEMMAALEGCKLGKETWKSVVFGADPSGGEEKMAFVLVVDGVGKKENLECIHGKIKEKAGEDPWTMEEKDGKFVLTMADGKGTGWVVDDNTIAVAGKAWEGAVKELIDGKGKPAIDNSLKDVVGRTDTGKAIWAAGTIPADMVEGSPAAGAKDAAGCVDVSNGLELSASVGFDSEETAKTKADELNKMFETVKGGAAAFGIPETVVSSVKIEAKGNAVAVGGKASKEDLDKITEAAKKAMGGGRGGGGGAPPPPPAEPPPAEPPPAE
jgi:hypothetical protein